MITLQTKESFNQEVNKLISTITKSYCLQNTEISSDTSFIAIQYTLSINQLASGPKSNESINSTHTHTHTHKGLNEIKTQVKNISQSMKIRKKQNTSEQK